MREKYESLSAAVLRELAKSRGIKGISSMKKSQLVEAMLAQDEAEATETKVEEAMKKEEHTAERTPAAHRNRPASEGRREHRPSNEHHDNTRAERTESTADSSHAEEPKRCEGILEVMQDGFGFIRSDNYLPGDHDVYVAPAQIRRLNLKTGDILVGKTKRNNPTDKFGALMQLDTVNGFAVEEAAKRKNFEDLTPIFPNQRIRLEQPGSSVAMRIVDLVSPIGKGQRGMIVSQPKAGKTTLLKEIAKSVTTSYPNMHLIILLIDERPEEVTDIREAIQGDNVEVIYSTFDELPEHHKRVSEMVMERKRDWLSIRKM